jgi:hypothetical protein
VWTFGDTGGDVATRLTERSYTFVDDLRDAAQSDRAVSKPDRGEYVTIDNADCVPGNYNTSATTVYGSANWFNTSQSGPVGVRVSLMCKRANGSQHRYRWGYASATWNCVDATRTSAGPTGAVGDVFSLAPGAMCPLEHHVISSSGKVTPVTDSLTFTSSITLLSVK